MLHHLAIEPRLQRVLLPVPEFVRRDEPGAERTAPEEVLAWRELRGVPLPVPDTAVVEARIAGNDGKGVGFRHMSAAFADDDGQFPFIVEAVGGPGTDQRLAVSDL